MSKGNVVQGNQPSKRSNVIINVSWAIGILLIVVGTIWYGLVGFFIGLFSYFFLMICGVMLSSAYERYGFSFLTRTDALRYVLTPLGFVLIAVGGPWRVFGLVIVALMVIWNVIHPWWRTRW